MAKQPKAAKPTTEADSKGQPKKQRGQKPGTNAKSRDNAKGLGKGMAEGSPTIVAMRREKVASLRARGATISQIEAALVEEGFVNPSRNKPWSRGVLFDDLEAVRQEWRNRSVEKIEDHFSRILAEVEEVKRDAWANGDRIAVLRAIDRECKMFGFNAPVKLQVTQTTQPGEIPPDLVLNGMTVEQLDALMVLFRQMEEAGKEPLTVAATLVSSKPVSPS